ncbi:Notchless protein-like protein, partial [Smittium culicis]
NPKANRLASSSKDGTVRVWDTTLRTCLFSVGGHTSAVTCVCWGGDGILYTSSQDKTIKMWNSEGKLIKTLSGHAHWVNSLAISSGFVLRTGAFDHTGTRYDDPAQAQQRALERYQESVGSKTERLVSGSDDYTMYLWDPKNSKKPIARLVGHQKIVNHVSFSPDGKYIASASFDNSVKLWDGYTGKFITSLRGHVSAVYQVCWSSDSRLLVSSSKDSTLKVWDMKTKKLKLDLPGHADEVEQRRLNLSISTPLGVHQWGSLVAVNYEARKSDTVREAIRKCPDFVAVHVATYAPGKKAGYHSQPKQATHKSCLDVYRRASKEVFSIFEKYCPDMQKGSVDEAYMDITKLVEGEIEKDKGLGKIDYIYNHEEDLEIPIVEWKKGGLATANIIFGEKQSPVTFGKESLKLFYGAMIAYRIREDILNSTGFTVSVGISHSKIVSKLASSYHKPNKQTIVLSSGVSSFMDNIKLEKLQSLGGKLGVHVKELLSCDTVRDLKRQSFDKLKGFFPEKTALLLFKICRGVDSALVSKSSKARTMSSVKSFSGSMQLYNFNQVKEWISVLGMDIYERLMEEQECELRWPKNITLSLVPSNKLIPERSKTISFPSHLVSGIMDSPNVIIRTITDLAVRFVFNSNPATSNKDNCSIIENLDSKSAMIFPIDRILVHVGSFYNYDRGNTVGIKELISKSFVNKPLKDPFLLLSENNNLHDNYMNNQLKSDNFKELTATRLNSFKSKRKKTKKSIHPDINTRQTTIDTTSFRKNHSFGTNLSFSELDDEMKNSLDVSDHDEPSSQQAFFNSQLAPVKVSSKFIDGYVYSGKPNSSSKSQLYKSQQTQSRGTPKKIELQKDQKQKTGLLAFFEKSGSDSDFLLENNSQLTPAKRHIYLTDFALDSSSPTKKHIKKINASSFTVQKTQRSLSDIDEFDFDLKSDGYITNNDDNEEDGVEKKLKCEMCSSDTSPVFISPESWQSHFDYHIALLWQARDNHAYKVSTQISQHF